MIEIAVEILGTIDVSVDFPGITIGGGGLGVDIIDQNSDVIAHVADGGTYPVIVLSAIVDDPDQNTFTIIDSL